MTKTSPAKSTGAHISIVGHISKDELIRCLDTTDLGNGFANRFLWLSVRRSKMLPDGGHVHVSIANPSLQSPLGYYRGKAQVEQVVLDSGLTYTILRPTVIFGLEDILINNIAWFIRHFPVFGIPGDGSYRIRPVYVEDMARLLADAVDQQVNTVLDAVGPEAFSFQVLVRLIASQVGRSVRFVHLPMALAYVSTLLTGWFVRDVVLTWEEYKGLMAVSEDPFRYNEGWENLYLYVTNSPFDLIDPLGLWPQPPMTNPIVPFLMCPWCKQLVLGAGEMWVNRYREASREWIRCVYCRRG